MLITFGLLGLSICAAWLRPVRIGERLSLPPWLLPFVGAVVAGLVEAYLTWPALIALGAFGLVTCMTSRPAASRLQRILLGSLTALLALALALHLLPGFHNPLLVANIKFSPDAIPFTQYANFDKAAVGLILLAFLANRARSLAEWSAMLGRIFPVALLTITVVIGAAVLAGYTRPDPKLSGYTPVFLLTNLLFCVRCRRSVLSWISSGTARQGAFRHPFRRVHRRRVFICAVWHRSSWRRHDLCWNRHDGGRGLRVLVCPCKTDRGTNPGSLRN
jgi:hypothetical protein